MLGTKRAVEKATEPLLKEISNLRDHVQGLQKTLKNNAEDWDRERTRLIGAENILKKKFDEEKALAYKTMELEFKGRMMEEVNKVRAEADAKLQKGIEENFTKLKDSLAKLHEEGNAQTKFTEQIALKMMNVIRPDQKQLTSDEE